MSNLINSDSISFKIASAAEMRNLVPNANMLSQILRHRPIGKQYRKQDWNHFVIHSISEIFSSEMVTQVWELLLKKIVKYRL